MAKASAFSLKVNTGSADEEGLLLLVDGRLVAVIVELNDVIHGHRRGNWCVEAAFGISISDLPSYFPDQASAIDWVIMRAGGVSAEIPQNILRLT